MKSNPQKELFKLGLARVWTMVPSATFAVEYANTDPVEHILDNGETYKGQRWVAVRVKHPNGRVQYISTGYLEGRDDLEKAIVQIVNECMFPYLKDHYTPKKAFNALLEKIAKECGVKNDGKVTISPPIPKTIGNI